LARDEVIAPGYRPLANFRLGRRRASINPVCHDLR
jgi:hypothetical protein